MLTSPYSPTIPNLMRWYTDIFENNHWLKNNKPRVLCPQTKKEKTEDSSLILLHSHCQEILFFRHFIEQETVLIWVRADYIAQSVRWDDEQARGSIATRFRGCLRLPFFQSSHFYRLIIRRTFLIGRRDIFHPVVCRKVTVQAFSSA